MNNGKSISFVASSDNKWENTKHIKKDLSFVSTDQLFLWLPVSGSSLKMLIASWRRTYCIPSPSLLYLLKKRFLFVF